jgi:hypothetical protein
MDWVFFYAHGTALADIYCVGKKMETLSTIPSLRNLLSLDKGTLKHLPLSGKNSLNLSKF